MKQLTLPGQPSKINRIAATAFAATSLFTTTGAADAQSAQFTTRVLSITNLRNPTEEVRISPNLLTKMTFPDDVIEEIKSGNPNLFTLEINEAGNEISLRAAAKAGFTDLYVKTTSGLEAAFLIKVVPDAQGGPRQYTINSPSMLGNAIPSTPASTSGATIPAITPVIRPPATMPGTTAPTTRPATTAARPAATATTATRPAPTVTPLTNPVTVAANTSEPVDYRTQAILDKAGTLTMYYEIRNISDRPLTIDPQNLNVTVAGRKLDFQLLRSAGVSRVTLQPGTNEIGAIMLPGATNLGSVDVSWILSDSTTSYTYTRSFNARDMQP